MSLPPGEVFAGFTIEHELGSGGMGVVYLARHPRLPRRVALKLLRTDLGADESFVIRFRREAETVARLDHPNIVAIDDNGADNGQLWISMRFIDGTTAAGALTEYEAGMPAQRAVHIIEKVSAALDFAHRHQVIHRDVKPANILLTQDADGDEERVYLTDFGVAKAMGEIESQTTALTVAGGVVATLDYAAPEQIEGKQLDGRCDVYALGCVLFTLLTGVIPYPGETLAAKIYARMHRSPPRPSALVPNLPAAFDDVVAKALALSPDDRYQTGKALAIAARVALDSSPRGETPTAAADSPDPDATTSMADRSTQIPVTTTAGPALDETSAANLPPPNLDQLLGPRPGPGTELADVLPSPGHTKRRSLLAIGAALLALMIVVGLALLQRNRRDDTSRIPSQPGASSAASPEVSSHAADSSADTTTSVPPTPSVPSKTTVRSATVGRPPAVVGLPHSIPLPVSTIVASRQYDKKFALYPIDGRTGKVGKAITKPITYAQNPLISPDRGSIVYLQVDAGGNTIHAVAADGTGDRVLFAQPQGCVEISRPAWNPSYTQQLAITCTTRTGPRTLKLIDLSGKVLKELPTAGLKVSDDLSFSPDGKLLVYWASTTENGGKRLYTQATDGSSLPKAITPEDSNDADPDFSPDGSYIVFSRTIGSHVQIWTVRVDGADPQQLTDDFSSSQGPVWSPDGRQIAYKNNLPRSGTPAKDELWVLAVALPHDPRPLVVGDAGSIVGSPAWGNR